MPENSDLHRATEEYINSLPNTVIENTKLRLKSTHPYADRQSIEDTSSFLHSKLLFSHCKKWIADVIKEELYNYHCLLGHV
jgi:hypothetical protein